jgi:hypothetical protein
VADDDGYSGPHAVAVIAASATMCAWPVLAVRGQPSAGALRLGPNVAASAITFGLIMWFTLAMNGGELGLAERCAAVAPALWLFPVAFGARRTFLRGESVEPDRVAPVSVDTGGYAQLDRRPPSRRAAAT